MDINLKLHCCMLLMAVVSPLHIVAIETFHESSTMSVINNNQLYSYFNFTTTLEFQEKFVANHYQLFPRSFGELMQKYQVAELHFTMTQGLWRYNQWGYPHSPSPTGAQLWVWFQKNITNVDKNWVGFTNALSGLFCASLNFINKAVTVSPTLSFRPTGALKGDVDNKFLRYGTLSRENLCTENLTPWMKLLPCGANAGPASLLNPSQLHHSQYLAVGIHFKTVCFDEKCARTFVQLQQDVSAVFDLRTSLDSKPNFNFMSVFLVKIKPACPLASSSTLNMNIPKEASVTPKINEQKSGYMTLDLFELRSSADFSVKWKKRPMLAIQTPPGITSHCYLTGLGLNGGLTCSLTNNMDHNLTVVFFQVFPWFLYTKLHTLKIETATGARVLPHRTLFTPARIRESPHILEVVFPLAANSVTDLQIQFTRGFLRWTEHPPDANHGFYISPATVTLKSDDLDVHVPNGNKVQRIYSEALLINIPVPDFSMPYNVICLVCTVIAVAFGSLHNFTTRRLQMVSPNKPSALKEMLNKLLGFFKKTKPSKPVDEKKTD